MAKVYADLIRKGLKTLDQVPERLREEVRRLLEEETA
jgi:hypothetical protein